MNAKIIVVVKKWFDTVNGNTYHKVKLFLGNDTILESKVTYGYETQYVHTAKTEYEKHISNEIPLKTWVELCEFEVIKVSKRELYR